MLISLFTLLLGACTSGESTDNEQKIDSEPEVVNVEVLEDSIVSSEITTTFKPEVTELRTLTEEDYGVRFKLKFKEDYSEAKLIELHVNGEEIVLN